MILSPRHRQSFEPIKILMVRHQSASGVRRELVGGSGDILHQEILKNQVVWDSISCVFKAIWCQTRRPKLKIKKWIILVYMYLLIHNIFLRNRKSCKATNGGPSTQRAILLVNSRSTGNTVLLCLLFFLCVCLCGRPRLVRVCGCTRRTSPP